MLLIQCPFCGTRYQSEFTKGGEAHVKRPDGS
ncbi:MAG: sarcosine oxidase subunit delta, partial [Pelagibacteraceae bacterium]